MQRSRPENAGIIGAGATGSALGALLQSAGYQLSGISTQTENSLKRACSFLDLPQHRGYTEIGSWCGEVDLLFLTVPDDTIESMANRLVKQDVLTSSTVVIHCSGAHGADELLNRVRQVNAHPGAFHPLQTIPNPQAGRESIPGSWIGIDGDSEVRSILYTVAEDIGGQPMTVKAKHRSLYHAAAVFACNHTIALLSVAKELMERSVTDVEDPLEPLTPLINASVDNALAESPDDVLTGPAVRGDEDTLRSHMDSLGETDEELPDLYLELTRRCLQIARKNGSLESNDVEHLISGLKDKL